MSWRTIVISNRAKLDFKMNYMTVRNDHEITRIFINEIYMVIIESTAVSITVALLSELTKKKVKVIFCNEKRNPSSELVSYYGSHDTSVKYRNQIEWSIDIKSEVWTQIVREKVKKQSEHLRERGLEEYLLLEEYVEHIETNDKTNREGHAAKVYFNALFGKKFTRADENTTNAALNYGYSIILSAFAREIVANGYMTQLGLFHNNMFNQFNLASDLMEPFRILIDRKVVDMDLNKFELSEKLELVNVLNKSIIIDKARSNVANTISQYTKSIFDALNYNDIALIRFYRNEL
ncbi:CRISPR-associated endonuclease Cas1 [Natranaerovirga pectinivora]|uniref:CRISPR-associated endonuclease Cas1 n=1 Tax=Natranaerovirga pectinivora TaxID=682400 RepID=A0A4R3MQ69_9FIRM|nr:type II CRISPR-associated endonuclease Cas1 [Natranaerovirga pectinivora]TCT14550.1 CRISPR-associated endonuclease Cas1 [Natranaerovirga pectinivora]